MSIVKFNTMNLGTYETDLVVVSINQTATANNKPMLKVTLSDGKEVTLNEANGWTASLTDLPKYLPFVRITVLFI